MALTADDIILIRSYISDKTPPTDEDLEAIDDRLGGTTADVVREVLRKRLAAFEADPASFAIPGEYQQNVGANIDAIRKTLKELQGVDDLEAGTSVVTVTHPVRRAR